MVLIELLIVLIANIVVVLIEFLVFLGKLGKIKDRLSDLENNCKFIRRFRDRGDE